MRKNVIATLAGVAVAGVVAASAVSLGNLSAQDADAEIVEVPVSDGLAVLWQSQLDHRSGHRVVSDLTLEATGGEELPEGATVKVVLTVAGGAREEVTGTVVHGGSIVPDEELPPIPADAVKGVSMVVLGEAYGDDSHRAA